MGRTMPARTHGLSHLSLAVADLERAKRFYEQAFGAREYYRDENSIQLKGPGEHVVLALELDRKHAGKAGGINHFGFRLVKPADLDAAVDAALKAGGKLKSRGEFAPGCPFAYVFDPDGYEIEIWFEP
jgi:catechol 2,3-dioxygenase-like lactoylglutathione lyase family enzyme